MDLRFAEQAVGWWGRHLTSAGDYFISCEGKLWWNKKPFWSLVKNTNISGHTCMIALIWMSYLAEYFPMNDPCLGMELDIICDSCCNSPEPADSAHLPSSGAGRARRRSINYDPQTVGNMHWGSGWHWFQQTSSLYKWSPTQYVLPSHVLIESNI